ncbi:hypothetical protein [Gemmata sp.]|uniref:hypothetical protein n=1 Tax=Gemmata sp. TaxID=1914242 RepID=UPI003F71BF23
MNIFAENCDEETRQILVSPRCHSQSVFTDSLFFRDPIVFYINLGIIVSDAFGQRKNCWCVDAAYEWDNRTNASAGQQPQLPAGRVCSKEIQHPVRIVTRQPLLLGHRRTPRCVRGALPLVAA